MATRETENYSNILENWLLELQIEHVTHYNKKLIRVLQHCWPSLCKRNLSQTFDRKIEIITRKETQEVKMSIEVCRNVQHDVLCIQYMLIIVRLQTPDSLNQHSLVHGREAFFWIFFCCCISNSYQLVGGGGALGDGVLLSQWSSLLMTPSHIANSGVTTTSVRKLLGIS